MFRVMGFPISLFFLCLYFLPTIIAAARKKTNLMAIFLVNLFLGWSVIGWVVALVWAVSTERVDQMRFSHPIAAANQQQVRYCTTCGKYDQSGGRFCAHCGAALG